jgi:hypothetical protein
MNPPFPSILYGVTDFKQRYVFDPEAQTAKRF